MIGYQNAPRYGNLARRVFGSDEILPPGIILEIDRPEWKSHKREFPWTTGRLNVAASVGNVSRIAVVNPLGSNRLTIVTHVLAVAKTTVGLFRVTVDAAAGGAPAPCLSIDTRLPFNVGVGAPTVMTQSTLAQTAAISGYLVEDLTVTVAAGSALSQVLGIYPVILAEGHSLAVFNTTVNEACTAYIYGYERVATPEEEQT